MEHQVKFEVGEEDFQKYKELQIYVYRKHGKIKGVLGHEIISLACSNPDLVENKEKISEPKGRKETKSKLLAIYHKLPEKGVFYQKHLDKMIAEYFGSSGPTLRNYKNLLMAHLMIIEHSQGKHKVYSRGYLPDWAKDVKPHGK